MRTWICRRCGGWLPYSRDPQHSEICDKCKPPETRKSAIELVKLRELVSQIAEQRLSSEMPSDVDADYEGAYDYIVLKARAGLAALTPQQTPESGEVPVKYLRGFAENIVALYVAEQPIDDCVRAMMRVMDGVEQADDEGAISPSATQQTPESGEPHKHRWVDRDSSGTQMCADCGVDLDDIPDTRDGSESRWKPEAPVYFEYYQHADPDNGDLFLPSIDDVYYIEGQVFGPEDFTEIAYSLEECDSRKPESNHAVLLKWSGDYYDVEFCFPIYAPTQED